VLFLHLHSAYLDLPFEVAVRKSSGFFVLCPVHHGSKTSFCKLIEMVDIYTHIPALEFWWKVDCIPSGEILSLGRRDDLSKFGFMSQFSMAQRYYE
jgi:hypothetical protein